MEKPRGTKIEEFHKVLELINKIFRINRGCEPTMALEFPLLLTKDNAENMRIIEKNGEPVSCVNYVKRNVLIHGSEISTASIGAVCTNDDNRGKGYSSLILDDVERKMEDEGVHVVLVSGTRSLYQRRGYTITKNFIKYEILPENVDLKFDLEEFEPDHLIEVARLYNMNSTRYVRDMEDFQKLITSALFPWGNIYYKKYFIRSEGIEEGYIFIKVINGVEKKGVVVEACGRADYIESGLKKIAYINELRKIEYKVNVLDRINFLYDFHERELGYQEGTVKILNFTDFMGKLRSYFANYVTWDILNEIKFEEIEDESRKTNGSTNSILKNEQKYQEENKEINQLQEAAGLKDFKFNVSEEILNQVETVESNKIYRIIYKDEMVEIKDIWTLNKLVFEGGVHVNLDLQGREQLKSFIDKVFPIPFIYAGNLNYQ